MSARCEPYSPLRALHPRADCAIHAHAEFVHALARRYTVPGFTWILPGCHSCRFILHLAPTVDIPPPFVSAPALFVVVPIHCCCCCISRFQPIHPSLLFIPHVATRAPIPTIHISDRIFVRPFLVCVTYWGVHVDATHAR